MTGPGAHRAALRATVLTVGVLAGGLLAGAAGATVAARHAAEETGGLATLERVMGLIRRAYVEEIPPDQLVAGAIRGMVSELDPHSTWMSAATWRDLQRETQGTYTGIGVEVQLTEEGARVVRVHDGSPASRDGLVVGDLVVAVDGRRVRASDLAGAERALLGPRGSTVTLEVLRAGWDAPRAIRTTRDEIHTPAVTVERVDGRVVYARIAQFQDGAAEELRTALDEAAVHGRTGAIVLDLRNNPGGLLREAVATADLFLEDGTIVSTWGRLPAEQETYSATPGSYDAAVVVLVNGLSASAAEIVAAALQDTKRGVLLGTRTYGKGSVQTVFEHKDGSALKLTIGRYQTPSGQPVAPRDGRAPDFLVPMPEDTSPAARLREAVVEAGLDDEARTRLLALVDELPDAEIRRIRDDDPRPIALRLVDDPQLAAAVAVAKDRAR